MSDRTPATDKGTADRIEADDGGYWVRLVTKQALRREGECMGNCLNSMGYGSHSAGDEEMLSDGLWSLRQANGVSYLLVEVDVSYGRDRASVTEAKGPKNSDPSSWSCRQFRHLVEAFLDAGCVLQVRDHFALTGADGMTWRPDKAPDDLRAAYEERQRRAQEEADRQRQEMEARFESMRAARREGRVEGRGSGLFDTFGMISLSEAVERMRMVEPVRFTSETDWRPMRSRILVADEVDVDESWAGRVLTNVPRYGVVGGVEGQPAAYLVPPLTGAAGIDLGERPPPPDADPAAAPHDRLRPGEPDAEAQGARAPAGAANPPLPGRAVRHDGHRPGRRDGPPLPADDVVPDVPVVRDMGPGPDAPLKRERPPFGGRPALRPRGEALGGYPDPFRGPCP